MTGFDQKMSKEFRGARNGTLVAEINAPEPKHGVEESAVFLEIVGRYATLSPAQARELADHLNALADAFEEAHKPPTRVEIVEAYPVGTVFKTFYATYVRTNEGAMVLTGNFAGEKRKIAPFFYASGRDASDLEVLYTPEVTE